MSSDIWYMEYPSDLILGEGLCIFTSFHFPNSGLYLLNGFDFFFYLFGTSPVFNISSNDARILNLNLCFKSVRNLVGISFHNLAPSLEKGLCIKVSLVCPPAKMAS